MARDSELTSLSDDFPLLEHSDFIIFAISVLPFPTSPSPGQIIVALSSYSLSAAGTSHELKAAPKASDCSLTTDAGSPNAAVANERIVIRQNINRFFIELSFIQR